MTLIIAHIDSAQKMVGLDRMQIGIGRSVNVGYEVAGKLILGESQT